MHVAVFRCWKQRVKQEAHIVHAALQKVVISKEITAVLRDIHLVRATIFIVIKQRLEGRLKSVVGLLARATVARIALVRKDVIIVFVEVASVVPSDSNAAILARLPVWLLDVAMPTVNRVNDNNSATVNPAAKLSCHDGG